MKIDKDKDKKDVHEKIKSIYVSMKWYIRNQPIEAHQIKAGEWLFILGQCKRLLHLADYEEEKERSYCYRLVKIMLKKISNKWRRYLTDSLNYWYSNN